MGEQEILEKNILNFEKNYMTNYMFCYNCKSYNKKTDYCSMKDKNVKKRSSCSVWQENLDPKHTKLMLEELRQQKTKFNKIINLFQIDKLKIIEEYNQENPFFYDEAGLFWFWNKELYKYEVIDFITLLNSLMKRSSGTEQIIKNQFYNEIKRGFQLIGRNNKPLEMPKTWIQFKNKIIDYKTKEIHPVNSLYLATNPIPWNIKKGETPTINKIFAEWVGEKYVITLKEIIAYCMITDYPLHRIFCLTGSGLNGKGVFQTLIRKILGNQNVSGTDLDLLMNNRFETVKLHLKLVCQIGETNFSEMGKTSLLKKLSGQDLVGIEYKGKNPFDIVNYAKLIINTNSLPPTLDKTDGFYRRWLIINFPNKFKEGIDLINQIPNKEIECLCGECINLINEIIKRGHFTNEGDIQERRKKYEESSNPLGKFIKENYVKNVNFETPFFEFYNKLSSFLEDRGFRILTKKKVSQFLENEGFETYKKDVKVENGRWTKWVFIQGLDDKKNISTSSTQSNHGSTLFYTREIELGQGSNGSNGSKLNEFLKNKKDCKELFSLNEFYDFGLNENDLEKAKKEGLIYSPVNGKLKLL